MDLTNVSLFLIKEEHIVILNGERYLMVERTIDRKRTYYRTDKLKEPVLEILRETPNLKSGEILASLRETTNIDITPNNFRSLLQRMRNAGEIKSEGITANTTWSVV